MESRSFSPTTGIFFRVDSVKSFTLKYSGLDRITARYLARAPTFLEMDISLSLRTMIRLSRLRPALFIPS